MAGEKSDDLARAFMLLAVLSRERRPPLMETVIPSSEIQIYAFFSPLSLGQVETPLKCWQSPSLPYPPS